MDARAKTGTKQTLRNPQVSVVIVVRDRWSELRECLDRLAVQIAPPDFEVVIVDDGSHLAAPAAVLGWKSVGSFRYVRQNALGIAAARNRGLEISNAELVLYIDSDCLVAPNCLSELVKSSAQHPRDVAFQLSLRGSHSYLVGCMEDLKLRAILGQKMMGDGHVEYANTSGFAVRRSYASARGQLFNPEAVRGEDTLVLRSLLTDGFAPRFVASAQVIHQPRLTLSRYLVKQFGVGYHGGAVRRRLIQENRVLVSWAGRLQMFGRMLCFAGVEPQELLAAFLVLVAVGIELLGRAVFRIQSALSRQEKDCGRS